MNIRSGFMSLYARKCTLSCKNTSYFNGRFLSPAPSAMAHENTRHLPNSLLLIGIASDKRCMNLESRSNTSLRSYQLRFYSSEAVEQNAGRANNLCYHVAVTFLFYQRNKLHT